MTEATTAATAPVTAKASAKALLKAIGMVRATGDKLNALIHETAMHAAKHAQDFGDPQYAQSLVMACPASMRRSMLILWYSLFTPIVVKDSDDWSAKMHKQTSKLYVPFDLEGGNLKPFWQLANEHKEGKVYDFDALVQMVKHLAKQIEKKVEEGKVKEEDIESAEAIVTQISGLNFTRVKHVAKIEQSEPNNDQGSDEQHEPVEQPLAEQLGVELKNVA